MKTGIIWEAHFHVFFFWVVSGTPVDDILDELRQQQIVNEEQREFIARHSTHKGRTRVLLKLLDDID
jgi:hypothetical protein